MTLGLYECTNCKRRFRDAVDKEKINIREIAQKVRVLEAEIVEATKRKAELEEKVKALEGEKACLLTEIEALKAIPELAAKATALDAEVAKLKEEKKALEEKAAPPPGETAPAEAPAEEKTCEQKPCE